MSYKILLAEDDPITKITVEHYLRKDGHSLYTCSDGIKAFDIILSNAEDYDLIITDIAMPNMDGTLLSFKIKVEMGLTIPIMALTSYEKELFKPELVRYFDSWLIKPINHDKLRNEIYSLFEVKFQETVKFRSDEK